MKYTGGVDTLDFKKNLFCGAWILWLNS